MCCSSDTLKKNVKCGDYNPPSITRLLYNGKIIAEKRSNGEIVYHDLRILNDPEYKLQIDMILYKK